MLRQIRRARASIIPVQSRGIYFAPPRNCFFGKKGIITLRFYALCAILLLATSAAAQNLRTLRGTVVDSNALPISDVTVEFRSSSSPQTTTTNTQGEFSFANIPSSGTLIARHLGFAPITIAVTADSLTIPLQIRMSPAPVLQRIEVSANADEIIPATPTSQFIISPQTINDAGSLVLDDVLRQAPGFTLFRRSGSLFANPTTQGVSLRGVGASGSSRATVLLDGIPINDPFGGWIYWNQIPRASVETITVTNGGVSDMYGGGALGGVINIETRPVQNSFATAEISYGNENTPYISFDAGTMIDKWGISASLQSFRTSGYILVPPDQRGSIDTRAGTADFDGSLQLSRKFGEQGNFFVRFNSLEESRANGTPAQTNNPRMPSLALGLDWTQSNLGVFSISAFASDEILNQNFSSIATNRNSETLTDAQRSPSQQLGIAVQWQRTFVRKHTVTAGIEARDVEGHSAEITFNAVGPTANLDAGGRQLTIGYFAQDAFLFASNWLLTYGGRVDTWMNTDGFINRTPLPTGSLASLAFPNRTESASLQSAHFSHTFFQTRNHRQRFRLSRLPRAHVE